ncbi:hypothetical protein QM012_008184 [Aureobasidium pullulans]|uniref:Uncharacterized protein n=1 Tax=Aureobasidium pullulans TaxID=5580 RepID=A0ABR0TIU9_AURPU
MAEPAAHMAPWKLNRKAVLVHAPEHDNVCCLAHVNISYGQAKQEGLITIKLNLKLAESNGVPRTIHLNILPELVDVCSVTTPSFKNMLTTSMLSKLRGVTRAAAVTTLSLKLKEPSIVLVPSGFPESVNPADPNDGDFYAISQISRTRSIRLHYSRQDLQHSDQLRLKTFASALAKDALKSPCINYSHFNGGTGAQKRNWTVFDNKPPSYNQAVLSGTVLGKRSRREDAAAGATSHTSCSSPPPWSPTEVCSSFEVDMPTEGSELIGASSHLVVQTPVKKIKDVLPSESDIRDTQPRTTSCSPATSSTQEVSPPNIVPTVFSTGRRVLNSIAEPRQTQKNRPNRSSSVEDMTNDDVHTLIDGNSVRKIIRDVVHQEKQSILAEHQQMCDEAEIQVVEAIEDGRLTIIDKADKCRDEIDDHCQQVRVACEESCEMLQTNVAYLDEASTVLKKTLTYFMSDFSSAVLTAERSDCRVTHPSAMAAQIIIEDFEHLAISDKVIMLTKVADVGFAHVFLTVNHELRKELVTAWTKHRTEQ